MNECASIGSDWETPFYCNLHACRSRAGECSGCSGYSYCSVLRRRSRPIVMYPYDSLKFAFMDGILDCIKLGPPSYAIALNI